MLLLDEVDRLDFSESEECFLLLVLFDDESTPLSLLMAFDVESGLFLDERRSKSLARSSLPPKEGLKILSIENLSLA